MPEFPYWNRYLPDERFGHPLMLRRNPSGSVTVRIGGGRVPTTTITHETALQLLADLTDKVRDRPISVTPIPIAKGAPPSEIPPRS